MVKVQTNLKAEALERFKRYIQEKQVTSEYQAVHNLIIRGLMDYEREKAIERMEKTSRDIVSGNMPFSMVERTEEHHKKKRHETVEDYLNCPVCFPKFEKAMLARGYVKEEVRKEPS